MLRACGSAFGELSELTMNLIFTQLCLAAGLQLAVTTGSPVEKVVELIKELKTKIETDGANEQKIYDKFACWSVVTKPTTVQHVYSTFEMRRYGMQIDG